MHVSVLSKESIELLQLNPGGVAIDCTLGGGGHTRLMAERVSPGGRVLAIDRDADAISTERAAFSDAGLPVSVVHGDFGDVARIAGAAGFPEGEVDGVLFDLGVSSAQLDDPERGFSFQHDGPLDMRMNRSSPVTAQRVLNQLPERELADVIRRLGEERWAARIARFVVERRPLHTTGDLAAAVEAAIPRGAWPASIHPATRTFRAIRMHVNDELGSLRRGLRGALDVLRPGGRMVVISFHSLEDGAVKSFLRDESRDCLCPPRQPVCTCGHRARLAVLTRKPVAPSAVEVDSNPRSRSARLRAAQKL